MESNTIILPVKAKHFKDAVFLDCENCAIANAAKCFFKLSNDDFVDEGVDLLEIKYKTQQIMAFWHPQYGVAAFEVDLIAARIANYDETIIFELELTEATLMNFKK